jgi:hypothetical protein
LVFVTKRVAELDFLAGWADNTGKLPEKFRPFEEIFL